MEINLKELKNKMVAIGFNPKEIENGFDGWTNSIVDALNECYNFEKLLVDEFKKVEWWTNMKN